MRFKVRSAELKDVLTRLKVPKILNKGYLLTVDVNHSKLWIRCGFDTQVELAVSIEEMLDKTGPEVIFVEENIRNIAFEEERCEIRFLYKSKPEEQLDIDKKQEQKEYFIEGVMLSDEILQWTLAATTEEEFAKPEGYDDIDKLVGSFRLTSKEAQFLFGNLAVAMQRSAFPSNLAGLNIQVCAEDASGMIIKGASTQGHMLVWGELRVSNVGVWQVDKVDIIIPEEAVDKIVSFVNWDKGDIQVELYKGRADDKEEAEISFVSVRGEKGLVIGRLVAGSFPDYQKSVVDNLKFDYSCAINRSMLTSIVSYAYRWFPINWQFSFNEEICSVKVRQEKEKGVYTADIPVTEVNKELPVTYTDKEKMHPCIAKNGLGIWLNASYLLTVCNAFSKDEIILLGYNTPGSNSSLNPFGLTVSNEEEKDFKVSAVLMPLKVGG